MTSAWNDGKTPVSDSSVRRVSVVLCTYNGERFLQAQLDSLMAQTRLPDEIVVRDDGSTDATPDLLRRFQTEAQSRGIAVDLAFNPTNLGYRKNFESALLAATGDLLFLCDQDDVWHPEKILRFAREFELRPDLGALHCDARLVDAQGMPLDCNLFEALGITQRELDRMHAGDAFSVLLRRNIVTGAAMAIRSRYLPNTLPFPETSWAHDEWLAIIISMLAEVDTLEALLIDYRQHECNQIGMRKRTLREAFSSNNMPRKQFIATTAQRISMLMSHTRGMHTTPEQWSEMSARHQHALVRSRLPERLLPRLRVVWRECRMGNYRKYGSGLRSIVSDAFNLQ